MNTILTDDERRAAIKSVRYGMFTEPEPDQVARAIEAAVLAKLAQQSPDVEPDEAFELGLERIALYTHPAPQQADRQRVPDEPVWRHPRIQALIGADARNRICIDLVWRILENPRGEFTAGDMEYWDKLHDKVQEVALAAAPEAPAQAIAVDERAAFEAWWEKQTGFAPRRDDNGDGYVFSRIERQWEAWQARAALDRQPLRGELILTIAQRFAPKTLGMHDVPKWVIPFARAIENAHGIDAAMAQRDGAA